MSKFSQVICFFTLLYFFLSLILRDRRKKGRERGRKKSTNDKTIIELGYRKISWFVSVSQISLSPTPLPFPYPLLLSTPATQATISPLYTRKRVKSDQHGPETLTSLTTFTSCTVFQIQPVLMPEWLICKKR